MTLFSDGMRLQSPDTTLADLGPTSTGEYLAATAGDALHEWPSRRALEIDQLARASGEAPPIASAMAAVARSPNQVGVAAGALSFAKAMTERALGYDNVQPGEDVPIADARARVKENGLERMITLPAGETIKQGQLDIMVSRGKEHRALEDRLSRGPSGFVPGALSVGTSFLVGAADPLNLGSAFIPVVGELRYAKLLADAGTSVMRRAGVRAAVGAAEGAVGVGLLEPLQAFATVQEGRDYTMAHALRSIIFGAALGSGLRTGGGTIADLLRDRRGRPYYPFDRGEAFDTHPPLASLSDPRAPVTPLAAERFPGERETANLPEEFPRAAPLLDAVADLPPQAQEDLLRGSIAKVMAGEPVNAGEILDAAARSDPRIADSIAVVHQPERQQAAQAIHADMTAKLRGAGMSEADAAVNAAIVAARYATLAERLGHDVSAAELYRREGIEVRGAGGADVEGRAFEQGGPQERVVGATVIVDGKVFMGHNHLEALDNARKAGYDYEAYKGVYQDDPNAKINGGFITSQGRVLSRQEAAEVVHNSGQRQVGAEWRAHDKKRGVLSEGAGIDRKDTDQFHAEWNGKPVSEFTQPSKIVGWFRKLFGNRPAAEGRAFDQNTEPEHIVGAAVQSKDGRVFTARTHLSAENAASAHYKVSSAAESDLLSDFDGFLTSKGRLVSREEALQIANKREQPRQFTEQGETRLRGEQLIDNDYSLARARERIAESVNEGTSRGQSPASIGAIEDGTGYRLPIRSEGADVGSVKFELRQDPGSGADVVQIRGAGLEDVARGKGYGVDAYRKIVDYALENGRTVWSDTSVSPEAANIYRALKRRGYDVQEITADQVVNRWDPNFKITAGPRSFNQSQPGFFSAVSRVVDEAKQDKAPGAQWLGMLKNKPGVKPEELEWLGLETWLKEQKGPVTKAQVQDYIRANQIEIKEVTKGARDDKGAYHAFMRQMSEKYGIPDEAAHRAYHSMSHEEIREADRLKAVAEGQGLAEFEQRMAEKYGDLWMAGDKLTAAERVERDTLANAPDRSQQTKFSQYQLPGGENYREMLLTLPSKKPDTLPADWTFKREPDGGVYVYNSEGQMVAGGATRAEAESNALFQISEGARRTEGATASEFRSSHWDEPNVLAHIRFNDRVIDGKRTLFIEEVQSDWHQAGKKKGYRADQEAEMARLTKERDDLIKQADAFGNDDAYIDRLNGLHDRIRELGISDVGVPDAPFKTTWPELSLKRMLRYAAENGYEKVAWTPGKVQAERYDLSKHLDSIGYKKRGENLYNIAAYPKKGNNAVWMSDHATLADIENNLGKEMAEKVSKGEGRVEGQHTYLEDLDLQVGGEGMKGFYDDILPAAANKLTKKYGARVGKAEMDADTVRIVRDEMEGTWGVQDPDTGELAGRWATREEAQAALGDARKNVAETVHTLNITPELRDAAMGGFPLFQRGGEGPRGRITLANSKAIVDLFTRADRSTFMHEMGHLWLDELARDAEHAHVPQALKDDLGTVLRWLGVDKASDIGTPQHEQWARAFEQYLAEGNAPSAALARAFEAFKQWLAAIYRSLRSLDTPLNDDIRGVMDRMLATDREIADRRAATWEDIARPRPEHARPEVVAASKAADAVGEPASLVKESDLILAERTSARVAAAEKAAAEWDASYKAQEAFLPDDLKAVVERSVKELDDAQRDSAHVLEQGAACLAAAGA